MLGIIVMSYHLTDPTLRDRWESRFSAVRQSDHFLSLSFGRRKGT